ncbi:MmgE/PrpD family protein [Shewanella glacialipiscicola]|uniref:MmgE/PrpD family protein n=1 Tax=Shewanella glacialipiscicola TaxID=614069 RepID=A0ABQ6J4K7_9GAMM|nr:MmgE/PrpD family protein [Shewanella glacialipiscicola]MCL1087431.1 MmgE/PrpD family protein [Shewanella glacialipiscicola]MCU7995471.1 MmgE/PrpD family protein [Shewanella glacialipiscicola]MCU8026718.1 MmgE/PrpD family protein [Shewanella glacialipiscicola]GIU11758.1 hypothetical protein TUM4636_21010 [Shewanella glacialipiscicola]GMA82174.1 hypothetical protein GCM10025855_17070 [Shewanella glacialipiscicola]
MTNLNSEPTTGTLTEQLVAKLLHKPITAADRQRSALHVIDWLACVAGGSTAEVAKVFASQLTAVNNSAATASLQATALWQGKTDWQSALQYNAALGNVLEMDDVHRSSILHAGPVVIPAALAMAEHCQANLAQFLDAVILGYEVTIRVGQAIGRSHYRYYHNTSSCAAFGAAMAAGFLLKLTAQQQVWALGNTGSRTGGLWQMRHEDVMTKQFHNAEASKSGVQAALLAKAGLTGPAAILEGPQGLFAATSNDAVPERVLASSAHWLMHDCTFKPWPACRHAHPAMDVVMQVFARNTDLDLTKSPNNQELSATIQYIKIGCYQDALTFCDRPNPQTELQAKFSIQHAVACLLVFGEPKLWHYQAEARADERVVAMRRKITLFLDTDIEANYPRHYGASVCMQLTAEPLAFNHQHQDTLGDPERPLSQQQIMDKADYLFKQNNLSQTHRQQLLNFDWHRQADFSAFTDLLLPITNTA